MHLLGIKHEDLQSLHFQSGVLIVCRGLRRVMIIFIRVHLLNRGRVDNGHWHDNIIWEAPLHLPVLLTQGTKVHATMHQAWVTWRVLHSARTWVSKIKARKSSATPSFSRSTNSKPQDSMAINKVCLKGAEAQTQHPYKKSVYMTHFP